MALRSNDVQCKKMIYSEHVLVVRICTLLLMDTRIKRK